MIISESILQNLYIKKCYSVSEIARFLQCSESKINYWLSKYKVSKRTISEAIYIKHNPTGDPFKIIEPSTLEESKLLGFGLGLYWGEGTKADINSVRLGNTDPNLIKKFLDFLTKICNVSSQKIRFGLQVFSDIDPHEALDYWSNEIGFSKDHFLPSVVISPTQGKGTYRKKSKYGVLTVYFNNTKLRNILVDMLK